MSQGFDNARAQVLIELGLQGEGVIDTAAEQMRGLQAELARLNEQNRLGQSVGEKYLDTIREIIGAMNELTRTVKNATEAERAHAAENLKYQQDLAKNAERMLEQKVAADQQAAKASDKVAADSFKYQQDLAANAAQMRAKNVAAEKAELADMAAADADMAKVRAALAKKQAQDIADANAEMTRSWQDRVDKQANSDQDDVARANDLLKQRQAAVKLDAEVNSTIIAGAKAEHSELTRTIELQVNPRMAASDKYRQSVDETVKATQRLQSAEVELAQKEKALQEARDNAAKKGNWIGSDAFSHDSPLIDDAMRNKDRQEYVDLLQKQAVAESDLVGAQVKHAASQGQVATATQKAAVAQKAMQTGTQAGSDKMMAWTRTVYFAAQGLEDLQYGFNAVVNNIPMVTMSIAQGLGASSSAAMAWAGGISLVAVGINSILIPAFKNFVATHEPVKVFFDELGKQLNPFHVDVYASSLERMTDRIKELTDKKIKVAIDSAEVIRLTGEVKALQKATEDANAILNKQTVKEMQAGKNIGADLETEEGRKAFGDAREKSANLAVENAPEVKKMRENLDKARNWLKYAQENMDVFTIASAQEKVDTRLNDLQTVKENVKRNERNRFNLDAGVARSGVGHEQQNAQGRFLANLRAAGQGDLADKIEHDISNAQSGLGTQAEIEAQGNANKSTIRGQMSKQSQTDHEQTVNKFASLYKTKEQEAIDKIVASAIIGQRAEDVVKAEVQMMLEQKMLTAGIDPVIAKQAAAQTMESAIDTSKANVLAMGDTPEAGSAALLDKLAAKPKGGAAAKADTAQGRAQAKNTAAANTAATAERNKFGKPIDTQVQEFLAGNQAQQEYEARLSRSGPQGKAELKRIRAEQKREATRRKRQVSKYNQSRQGKRDIAAMSPEERAALKFQQNAFMQTAPLPGANVYDPVKKANVFDPQAGAKAFAAQGVENSMQAAHAPGADDPLYRNAQAAKIVEQSQLSVNALIEGNMNQTGNMLEATLTAQSQLAGQLRQQNARLNRMAGMVRGNHGQINDLRQSAANTVD